MRHLPATGYEEQPWANGGGVTREIARASSGDDPRVPFDWRLSLAQVTRTGPFSSFPGVDRTLTVLEGTGLVLAVAGQEARAVLPQQPCAFPGDVATDAALIEGSVSDLNVMTRRAAFRHRVDIARGPRAIEGPGAIFALEPTSVAGISLSRLDSLILDPGDSVITGDAPCLVIRFEAVT